MKLPLVLWTVGICVFFVVCLMAPDVDAAGKKNKNKKNKNRKKGNSPKPCNLKAEELEKEPFQARCGSRKSRISNISVVGHKHGTPCKGLTPDLFVQMNSCFWKSKCTLKYSTRGPNYMLKLYEGTISDCVTQQPDTFVISYECTSGKVKQLHVIRKPEGEGVDGGGEVKDKEGVMVSHPDHPWLYRRHHPLDDPLREELTLHTPKKKFKALTYTIRTLNLMGGDNLTVKWTADGKAWEGLTFGADHELAIKTHVISKTERVIFSLNTARHTNGGEGFVICFKWSKRARKGKKPKDACKKLLVPKGCGGRGGESQKKEGDKAKGGKP